MRLKGFRYEDWLLLCFVLGLGAGMALALVFGVGEIQGEILGAGAAGKIGAEVSGVPGRAAKGRAFWEIFRMRSAGCLAGWVAGLTVCSRFLFGLLTFHAGMSMAAVLTVLTVQRGILGFPLFLGTFLPQGIFYGLAWGVLAGWAGQREKKIHLFAALLLLGIMAAGAAAEVWVLTLKSG